MKPIFLFMYNLYPTYFQKEFQRGSDGLPHRSKVAQYVRYATEPQSTWNYAALLSRSWLQIWCETQSGPKHSGYEDHGLARWWVAGTAATHIPHQESWEGEPPPSQRFIPRLITSPAMCPNLILIAILRSWGLWHTTLPEPAWVLLPPGRRLHCP